MNHRSISFPDWKDTLARAALPPEIKAAYTREILTFLRLCKATHSPATVALVKEHLAVREPQSTGPAREALRWFFREGVRQQARPVELVAKKISPQRPAAPFPTHLLDGGADSSTVQELLGHASVETTQIYTHVMHPPSPSYGAARKPGLGVRSPFDSLRAGPLDQ